MGAAHALLCISDPMIEISALVFHYGAEEKPVFDGFSWRITSGESWAIIGPSGCGKTTLLYLIAGLRLATRGQVAVGGQIVRRPRPGTGLILQDYGLLPWATLRQNVELGLRIRRFYGPDGKHAPRDSAPVTTDVGQVQAWLDRLGIADQAHRYPTQVSGGQRQRAAIARTLVLEPDLLLMDEPFSSLDAPTREDLQRVVVDLQRETGITMLIVTHSIEEAVFMGRRILVLQKPPNRDPQIVENPGAGTAGYRSLLDYQQQCNRVRSLMGLAV